ncbi:uncharacterized protein TNCV_172271 [Trichonephila clavipes]|nr:uncharacterized protein TNCV_172271 [Trichonephila clavipes]
MSKESESSNDDKNPADRITYSQNSELEEVLIFDEEPEECEFLSYEMRVDQKLRDLDLLEEGMTIEQKQELLAVVVASWETAEKEKRRREFIQEYMNVSEAFCNDDIEFNFQESELSNDASLLPSVSSCVDVNLSVDSPNISCYSGECANSSLKRDCDTQHTDNEMVDHPSVEICENALKSEKKKRKKSSHDDDDG